MLRCNQTKSVFRTNEYIIPLISLWYIWYCRSNYETEDLKVFHLHMPIYGPRTKCPRNIFVLIFTWLSAKNLPLLNAFLCQILDFSTFRTIRALTIWPLTFGLNLQCQILRNRSKRKTEILQFLNIKQSKH